MKPVNITLLAAAIALGGTWVQKKTINVPMVIGGAFISLAIIVLDDAAPKLAESMAWLLLASTVGAYGEDLFTMVGKLTTNGGNDVSTTTREPAKVVN